MFFHKHIECKTQAQIMLSFSMSFAAPSQPDELCLQKEKYVTFEVGVNVQSQIGSSTSEVFLLICHSLVSWIWRKFIIEGVFCITYINLVHLYKRVSLAYLVTGRNCRKLYNLFTIQENSYHKIFFILAYQSLKLLQFKFFT